MREPIRDKNRLEHILDAIDNIMTYTNGKSAQDLDDDSMLFFAVVKNIEIIGEAAFKLTKSFCEKHEATPWESIMKMRHVLVHDYYRIKSKEVWIVVTKDLEPLREQISYYLANDNWDEWNKNEYVIAESAVKKNIVQTAKRMLAMGYELKEISDITGLTIDEINDL